jgi:hypothetical protein
MIHNEDSQWEISMTRRARTAVQPPSRPSYLPSCPFSRFPAIAVYNSYGSLRLRLRLWLTVTVTVTVPRGLVLHTRVCAAINDRNTSPTGTGDGARIQSLYCYAPLRLKLSSRQFLPTVSDEIFQCGICDGFIARKKYHLLPFS